MRLLFVGRAWDCLGPSQVYDVGSKLQTLAAFVHGAELTHASTQTITGCNQRQMRFLDRTQVVCSL